MWMMLVGWACTQDHSEDSDSGRPLGWVDTPSMTQCRQWVQDQMDDAPAMVCEAREGMPDWREDLLDNGGVVFSVGGDRYGVIWLSENWDAGDPLLYIVHNTDGCPEYFVRLWDNVRGDRPLGVVAVSYRAQGSENYDSEETIYANLAAIHAPLAAHCPTANSTKAYYGFSRGGGRGYGISVIDQMAEAPFLDAFLLDSGVAGTPRLDEMVLEDARFWLWCGERDPDPINSGALLCDTLRESLVPYVENYGGSVDALTADPEGCHGMFYDCPSSCADCRLRTDGSTGVFPAVFSYLDDL